MKKTLLLFIFGIFTTFGSLQSQCNYTLEMLDSYGDGWNDALIDVLVNGTVVLNDVTLVNGASGTMPIPVNTNDVITTQWVADGSYPGEVSYNILDANGVQVAGPGNQNTNLGPITATCPSCTNPVNITIYGTTASWDAGVGATSYDWEVQPSGTPQGTMPPAASGNTTMTMTTISGLTPLTAYDFYIKSDCMNTWAGPVAFTAPSANDDCANAIPLTVDAMFCDGTNTNGDNTAATQGQEPVGSCFDSGENGVWFSFVAPASGSIQVSTDFAGGTNTDTEVAVYDMCGAGATELGCDQDGGSTVIYNSVLNLNGLTAGTTYYIVVSGYAGSEGTFCIEVTSTAGPPPNDDCANAMMMTVGTEAVPCTNSVTIDATNATDDGFFSCDGYGTNTGTWYTFIAPASGTVNINFTPGTATGTPEIAWFDACAGNELGCYNQLNSPPFNISGLTPGNQYWLVLWFDSGTGSFDLCFEEPSCIPATFTLANGSNGCPTPDMFTIDVDITALGSASELTITDDQGIANTMTMNTGIVNVGPYQAATTVKIYVADTNDPTCLDSMVITTPAGCPPANDECDNAIGLTVNPDFNCGTTTPGTTVGATASPQPDDVTGTPNNDVWFSFVATSTSHKIDLLNVTDAPGGPTSLDMGMGLYDGSGGCNMLVFVADSDPNSFTATGLTVGTTYYLRVYGWSSDPNLTAQTTFDVCIGTPPPPPANDDCANAMMMTVGSNGTCPANQVTGSTVSATNTMAVSCDGFGTDYDIWYTFTVPSDGDYLFNSLTGSPGIVLYTGMCGSLVEIQCINNTSGTLSGLTMGTMYTAQIWTDSEEPTVEFCIEGVPPPPANDNLCMASSITVDALPTSATTTLATGETNEPEGSCWQTGGNGTMESVWFTFVAPSTGAVTVSTDFAAQLTDTRIAIYEAPTDCADMTTLGAEVGCDEDGGSIGSGYNSIAGVTGLTPGNTYYIQVDGYSDQEGDFMIEVKSKASNDACSGAITLATDIGNTIMGISFAGANDDDGNNDADGAAGCENANTSTSQNDIWYHINTDNTPGDGQVLEITCTPSGGMDVVLELYDGCDVTTATLIQCKDDNMADGVEMISAAVNLQSGHGNSGTRNADYYLRVYEKSPSGGTFDLQAGGSALPIELSAFTAKSEKRGNRIEWATASEVNTSFFEIQASADGVNKWTPIAKVEAAGYSSEERDYTAFDQEPYPVTYYRLRSVDNDGREDLSYTVKVIRNDRDTRMVVSPNPNNGSVSVFAHVATAGTGSVRITDLTGATVMDRTYTVKEGINILSVDLAEVPAGVYILSLTTAEGTQLQKIVRN